MFFRLLQYATVCFGSMCVFMSFVLFTHFIRSRKPIGKAVGLMLLGESIGGAVTVVFAITAEGIFEDALTPPIILTMRWVMFSAAFLSSVHLAVQTYRIETGTDD